MTDSIGTSTSTTVIGTSRRLWAYYLITFILFALVYFTTFRDLFSVWSSDEDYSHGFVILPISLYLLWRKRDVLASQPIQPSMAGTAVFVLWVGLYSIGMIARISTIEDLSMLVFTVGVVGILASWSAAKVFLFPSFFLIFMFPIPSEIYTRVTNPLLLISTTMSFHLLDVLGLPVLQEGNLLSLPNYSMQVVLACSGIRSLITIMTFSMLMGYLMTSSNFQRFLVFIIAIPIAMLGNVFRITVTSLLAYYVSHDAAEGYSHAFAGLVTFGLSLALLYGCVELILWYSKKKESLPSSS